MATAPRVVGPGLITVNAANDAGGIAAYASVGVDYGYHMRWGCSSSRSAWR